VPNTIQQFADADFNMGLNVDIPDIMKTNEELTVAENLEVMNRGGIRKRGGLENVNTTAYTGRVTQLFEWPRDDGNIHLMAIINKELCDLAGDGSYTSIQTLNSERVAYFFLQDKLYFIDPGTEYYVYDGSTVQAVTPNPDSENNLAPIKNCQFAHYHSESNRIFFAGNHKDLNGLYYSEYLDPTFVKGTSVVYPTRAEGPILGLSVLMDAIIVGYRHGSWIWRGIDPAADAIWEKLPTAHGPINGDAFALTTASLSMVSDDGIFALLPSIIGISMENEADQNYIANITKDRVSSIIKNCTNKPAIRTVFHSESGRFMMAYSDAADGINNKILTFDFDTAAFSIYTGIQVNDFCQLQNGDLYAASDNFIFKFTDDSTEDIRPDGTAAIIPFKMRTAKYNFGNPFLKKNVHKIFIIFKNYGEIHELKVSLYVDDTKQDEFILNGDNSDNETITKRIKTLYSGNNFQLEIENTQYSPAEIYGIGFYYSEANTGGGQVTNA